ncbi:hypothetical protein TNCV_1898371 [Trichonephila clavipes]|uniref:Uncharacterized protein n=1 Tax=Trichonephila clavipes TaxID=2585209 RepID=A0A8X6WEL7_TRICX|nr:hypothetical protein TNCV_1898371 [Trichonephila clavipes]
MPVIRRIGEPYSWQACEQLRHFLLRWKDGPMTAAREGYGSFARLESPMKEGRFDLGTFRSVRKYFHAKTIVFA